ncbi:PAS domain-containing protein [Schleiferia thermophila]|uniref:histidine kinase n=1 Tax=Schleiferia thermophila TaxID=884107 RepID=A0A369A7I0_9FLAO|nr:PAS domain S-box protein [Schleiferia thermophila]RCX05312.1 PAS domain S-box-containing protein [Schleiferia thermophila]GCD79180.1 hypothetical protein JCM30197_04270 [Schleiferia thermophila]
MIVSVNSESSVEVPDYLHCSKEFPVLITDLKGIIRYINRGYSILYGYSPEEVLGHSAEEQVMNFDFDKMHYTVNQCLNQIGIPQKVLLRKPCKYGKGVHFTEWEFTAIPDTTCKVAAIFCLGKIVTPLYTGESDQIKEEFLTVIDQLSSEAWAFYDCQLKLRLANRKAVQIVKEEFGREPLPGDDAMLYTGGDHAGLMRDAYSRALKGETIQYELTSPNGRSYILTIKPVYSKKSALLGVVHYMVDITQVVQNKKQLNTLSTRYKTLLDQLSGLVLIIEQDGQISFVSENVQSLSGFSKEQVIGKNFLQFVHQDDWELSQTFFKEVFSSQKPNTLAIRTLNSDQTYNWTLVKVGIFEEDGQSRLLVLLINIEETKQKEALIEDFHETFRRIAFLQSHVVRAPLARLLGLTQALENCMIDNRDELEKFIQYIKEAAFELDGVIHQIVKMTTHKD